MNIVHMKYLLHSEEKINNIEKMLLPSDSKQEVNSE